MIHRFFDQIDDGATYVLDLNVISFSDPNPMAVSYDPQMFLLYLQGLDLPELADVEIGGCAWGFPLELFARDKVAG